VTALGRWLRSPRHVLVLFLGVTGSLSLAMGWLAWQLVAQDRALASQRRQERLDSAADAGVAALRSGLEGISQRLGSLSKPSPLSLPDATAEMTPALEPDAVVVLAGNGSFDVWPVAGLVYFPDSVVVRDAPDATASAFAEGEALEFGTRDLQGALRAYTRLARSPDPRVRAGASLRCARVWTHLHEPDRALHAYDELAALGATSAEGLPAGLLARYGRCLVLEARRLPDELGREAQALARDLEAGTWRLTRAEYEFYRNRTREWLGTAPGRDPAAGAQTRQALAAAVATTWDTWGVLGEAAPTPPAGSRLVRADGTDVLLAWQRDQGRVAALMAGPRFVDAHLVQPANATLARYRAHLEVTDADGRAVSAGDQAGAPDRPVRRTAAETALPWSVGIVDDDPGGELAAAATRNRIVLAALAGLGVFVLAGSTLIVRAVNRELEISRLQTDFVSAVSHEFRTPLTSIRQASELLLDGRVPEGRREEYYRMQDREAERLQRLVESLLDFGRMESGARPYRLEPIEVTGFVRELIGEFSSEAAAGGYRIEGESHEAPILVAADREALGRAIWNLLDNAVKYSPSVRTVWVKVAVRDGRVEISVRDRGVGVPADDQRRIFDKFARGTSAAASGVRGAGLGLAMVRHIVDGHHGSVRLDSVPGEGSTFTIVLPPISVRQSGV
jgi:signal transduction histidine kinase